MIYIFDVWRIWKAYWTCFSCHMGTYQDLLPAHIPAADPHRTGTWRTDLYRTATACGDWNCDTGVGIT